MEISYSLAEQDLIALAEFQVEMSGAVRKQAYMRRFLYPLGFGLLALGAFLVTDDLILLIMFGLMAVLSFLFAPTIFTRLAQRRIPRVVRSKMGSTSIGDRIVSANVKGIQQRAGELFSEVPWRIVNDIVETPSHVFVAIDGTYSLVIPKDEVGGNELDRFVELLRNKVQKADA